MSATPKVTLSTVTADELAAGRSWANKTLTWKVGTRHNQQTTRGDANWCTGAAWANLIEALTGKLISGKRLYEHTRQTFSARLDANPTSSMGGASLQETGHVLLRDLKLLHEVDLVHLRHFDDVMAWLTTQGPVVFGTTWPTGMLHPRSQRCTSWMEYDGPDHGMAHAACIVGTSHKRHGFLRIENSYGMTWGAKGLAWMPHTHFHRLMRAQTVTAMALRLPAARA